MLWCLVTGQAQTVGPAAVPLALVMAQARHLALDLFVVPCSMHASTELLPRMPSLMSALKDFPELSRALSSILVPGAVSSLDPATAVPDWAQTLTVGLGLSIRAEPVVVDEAHSQLPPDVYQVRPPDVNGWRIVDLVAPGGSEL